MRGLLAVRRPRRGSLHVVPGGWLARGLPRTIPPGRLRLASPLAAAFERPPGALAAAARPARRGARLTVGAVREGDGSGGDDLEVLEDLGL